MKLLIFSLLFILAGCFNQHAVYSSYNSCTLPQKRIDDIVVLLDKEPDYHFYIVGELQANSIDSNQSISMMRELAAKNGLDGIYWVDCSLKAQGHCSAKGFVYQTNYICTE